MFNLDQNSNIHIIGIGGIGMSGIARILHRAGFCVQGSDKARSKTTEELIDIGIKVFHSHHRSNISNVDLIIRSSAIKDNNPEILYAKKHSIKILERWEILNKILKGKHSITITGAHGKTTTTGLLGHIFKTCDMNPNILVGGIINNFHSNYVHGDSDIFIVEADESDATFVRIPSESAIVTNLDSEHLDYYQSFANLKQHYEDFIEFTSPLGITAINGDDPNLKFFNSDIDRKITTFGIENKECDLVASNFGFDDGMQTFDINFSEKFCSKHKIAELFSQRVKLSLLGKHNVMNALGAVAVCLAYNLPMDLILDALKTFKGMKRRFTVISEIDGVKIVDDYAHHPVEITKTIEAANQAISNDNNHKTRDSEKGKIIAILQPHKFTRLQENFKEFAIAFDDVDHVFVVDVYSAGEEEIEGINSLKLAEEINMYSQNSSYIADKNELFENLKKLAERGDYVLFLGAGDITKTAYDFAQNYANI